MTTNPRDPDREPHDSGRGGLRPLLREQSKADTTRQRQRKTQGRIGGGDATVADISRAPIPES
jgi:hypothetical protein